jgi:DNA (cytosine-5)-methyltransferase 1
VPDECEEPIVASRGVLRPVSRILKSSVDSRKRLSDGRIAISSLVGFGDHARLAHIALFEIAARICRPEPDCTICPVERFCLSSRLNEQIEGMLPVQ